MKFKELLKGFLGHEKVDECFDAIPDSEGINFVLEKSLFDACSEGNASPYLLLQYTYLKMLQEQGEAEQIANGFVVPSPVVAALEEDGEQLLRLPPRFDGKYETSIKGETFRSNFEVQLIPITSQGERVPKFQLRGPYLCLSSTEQYRLHPAEFMALASIQDYQINSDDHTEDKNLWLIGLLQKAKLEGMDIDLSHFRDISVEQPEKIGLTAVTQSDGSLVLAPNFGVGVEPDDFESRKWQLECQESGKSSLRVKDKIVVLDEQKLAATHEILTHRHIPKEQVQAFLKAPSAFIDASLVDLDLGFSVRVKGATRFTFMQFGETDESGIRWFEGEAGSSSPERLNSLITTEEDLQLFEEGYKEAKSQGAEEFAFAGETIDISDREKVAEVVTKVRDNISKGIASEVEPEPNSEETKEERATVELADLESNFETLRKASEEAADIVFDLDFSQYKRTPFPHQEKGIRWLLGLAKKSTEEETDKPVRLQGALLADDMGLGKTYMSLVGISELYRYLREQQKTCKPVLVVAPLSLLENWEDEVASTFKVSPFEDVVVLQSGRDLKNYRQKGARAETKQRVGEDDHLDENAIRYSLNVGKSFGANRLDKPKRLVLATYQTLRDYQFSLCRIDWSMVVFDEAQNIKNPNTLQTRAAKGLKADFKLLATGTPVENSLADFWCIMDTAQPGLLGDWDEFKQHYVQPITSADKESEASIRKEVGEKLRADVGLFMLRRLKEDQLEGLPEKRIYTGHPMPNQPDWVYQPELGMVMKGRQLKNYDGVLKDYQAVEGSDRRTIALSTLQKLRQLSLHPSLENEAEMFSSSRKEAEQFAYLSAKLESVVNLLASIQQRDEKVLIFLINKKLQRLLKLWLQQIFSIPVEIINGDTKAVASKKGAETRKGIITQFESKPGFGILIMSPVAAGVGLTVVGANNVIHLERHWNPAKEAQATDRVYRIGQKKDVNIYLPTLHHPERSSFDVNLDLLLSNKLNLKDAVVTPQAVSPEDMASVLSG